MKRLAVLFFVLIAASCHNSNSQEIKKLNAAEFQAALDRQETVQLLDVRSPEEFGSGHLEEAKNININGDGFAEQLDKLDKEKPLFLYCASGVRSARASTMAAEKGFKEIYDLSGGIGAWRSAKLPVVQTATP